ncbi:MULTISPECIES: hypothetical protein [unclassified Rhizobium]|jgi:hypothetical protein|uniref:hypothetical protein n=1 Tax=unclassified Rhizobium TaxID=2613769 RepID=UPI000647A107|nr:MULTISPECIES: hypothetical protein [unclassified Rhizobium]MBN8953544.1 hypothetical protein [Rhizobium tropici]OJY73254.1 MAG: hypothetical protein BGP09_19820 [Rhizobium sp. 60-20]RKD72223.1 hypothetical protein BJ928_1025 [Rhizobium sp. WW_1]
MIRHDLTHWPLVLSAAHGVMSLDEQLAFFSDWDGWLDRGESFSTLRVFTDAEALKRPEGGAKEAKVWLQANGERIRQLVIGMATVVPPEALEDMSRMNAEKLFGVPAQMFDDVNEAAMWLASLEATQGRPLDVGRALRGLTALRRQS